MQLPAPTFQVHLQDLSQLRVRATPRRQASGHAFPQASAVSVPVIAGAAAGAAFSRWSEARGGHRGQRGVGARAASAKSELLELLSGENWDASRVNAAQRVEDLVAELVGSFDKTKLASEEAQTLLAGRWKLLNTFTPGQAAANLFSLKSWQEYVFGKGPSPVQAAAFTNSAVQKVYQALDLTVTPGRWYNVIDASPLGIICLEADLSTEESDLRFQWTGGRIVIRRPPWTDRDLEEPIRLPYPVPFKLLGDRARGIFETDYLDEDLRISRGSKSGSVFVLTRVRDPLPMEDELGKIVCLLASQPDRRVPAWSDGLLHGLPEQKGAAASHGSEGMLIRPSGTALLVSWRRGESRHAEVL
ncbi:putative plastid-lipid-associated protein 12, chloroplastic [Symbiodinium microadriaticum]|uniref:Putative plastid-lipid-associated protein 12, chloroplastic n=1 Tax=Symbiodinium microadriaticum TaxID=2951 RepID=A0A1Q9ET18_SYMMI|nr:putative plastid-lipid-associated protein 12, chloroplastic [Symbiodinium microadriaticum]